MLIVGFLLGGTIGIGTVVYAVTIGPIAHVTIPAFSRGRFPREHEPTDPAPRQVP